MHPESLGKRDGACLLPTLCCSETDSLEWLQPSPVAPTSNVERISYCPEENCTCADNAGHKQNLRQLKNMQWESTPHQGHTSSKKSELETYVNEKEPDIVCLTELDKVWEI